MKNNPYIGVTGFMQRGEVDAVLQSVPEEAKRWLMIGVLVSSKTLDGVPNKWPGRYPSVDTIAGIFHEHPAAFNLVHFSTDTPERLLEQMVRITELGGEHFHGFQLNMKWPDSGIIRRYKDEFPDKAIVLQCGHSALKAVGFNPSRLSAAVRNYEGICDYVLIDLSGGLGKPLDVYDSARYLAYLNVDISMNLGIAGGLNADTLTELFVPIARAFPNISIDAEGKLRTDTDNLDIQKAKAFVSSAYDICSKYDDEF